MFHLHDQASPNRIKVADAKAIIRTVLPSLSADSVKDALSKMDPKKTGWVLPLPFMHAVYWNSKSMSVAQLHEALKPVIGQSRNATKREELTAGAQSWSRRRSQSSCRLRSCICVFAEAGRKQMLHAVFEAFDHGRKGQTQNNPKQQRQLNLSLSLSVLTQAHS